MKDKREKLEQIKTFLQNKNIVIVATGKYIGEGFDESRLDTLFSHDADLMEGYSRSIRRASAQKLRG